MLFHKKIAPIARLWLQFDLKAFKTLQIGYDDKPCSYMFL